MYRSLKCFLFIILKALITTDLIQKKKYKNHTSLLISIKDKFQIAFGTIALAIIYLSRFHNFLLEKKKKILSTFFVF